MPSPLISYADESLWSAFFIFKSVWQISLDLVGTSLWSILLGETPTANPPMYVLGSWLFLEKITVALMTRVMLWSPKFAHFFYFRKVFLFSKCPRLLVPSVKRRERGVLSLSCSIHKHLPYLCRKNMATVVEACFYSPPVWSAQDWGRLSQDIFLWSMPVSEFLEHWTVLVNTLQLNKYWSTGQRCICLMRVWKFARLLTREPVNCYWKLGKPPIPQCIRRFETSGY